MTVGGTGSFDWTVVDVFLSEPGLTYQLPGLALGRTTSQRCHHRHRAQAASMR
jgi:hypothetical protein